MQVVHVDDEVSVVRMFDDVDYTSCLFSSSSNNPDTRRVAFASLAIMLYIQNCLDVLLNLLEINKIVVRMHETQLGCAQG